LLGFRMTLGAAFYLHSKRSR